MAYSDASWDNARLLKRTVLGVADFSGRSRRTELVYYVFASALLSVVLNFAVSTSLSFEASLMFGVSLQWATVIPMFALLVRRLHDQDRTGWWGLLLPIALLLRVPRLVAELHGDIQAAIAQKASLLGIVSGLCGLAVFVIYLWPGTVGTNRYGADPRLEDG